MKKFISETLKQILDKKPPVIPINQPYVFKIIALFIQNIEYLIKIIISLLIDILKAEIILIIIIFAFNTPMEFIKILAS